MMQCERSAEDSPMGGGGGGQQQATTVGAGKCEV